MKMSNEEVMIRRNQVMQNIQDNKIVHVNELSALFKVSELTIRRDLLYWENKNAVERFYGGARLIQNYVENDAESVKEACKHAIAKYAAQLVSDGDTIFINSSSTAILTLQYIKKNVTVITNNSNAINIKRDPSISLHLTGGEIRIPKNTMVGDFALNNLKNVSAAKVFLGCAGFSYDSGMTTAILNELPINRKMINHCIGSVYILADHSKIGKDHNFISGDPSQIDYLITDTMNDPQYIEQIKEAGITTITLDPLKNCFNE